MYKLPDKTAKGVEKNLIIKCYEGIEEKMCSSTEYEMHQVHVHYNENLE